MSHNYNLTTQNGLMLAKLTEFYNNNKNLELMLNIINGSSKVSLRLVDWFTTNYAKANYIVYKFQRGSEIIRFKPFDDYKLNLRAYSKKRFDPFCRWERIYFPYKHDTYIQTTIGQLNFFRWAIQNNIIDYIIENFDAIESDMNARNSQSRLKQLQNENVVFVKRSELSMSAVRSIKKEDIEVTVTFT